MRVRSHQNPFSVYREHTPIDSSQLFSQPQHPLILEIGSAGGKFLLEFSKRFPHYNIIGIEIRKMLVDRVNNMIDQEKINNARVIHANANTAITQLFLPGQLDMVFIFFPDPWIKKRHLKRRLVNENLTRDIHTVLKSDGDVFIQTDVPELAQDIMTHFETNPDFTNLFGKNNFANENYTGVLTERETYCIEDQTPIYRLRYQKTGRI